MATNAIPPVDNNYTPDLNISPQTDPSTDPNGDDLRAPAYEARMDRNEAAERSMGETNLSQQEARTERQNEIEFRNNDGDTATLTRRGREASQITANQPV
jgi:hypothetical protein